MFNHRVTSIGEILFDVYPDHKCLGGASFNFIYHVKKLTGSGDFISRVGADLNGIDILEFLKANDFSTKYIQIDPVRPTGIVNVTLNENKIPKFKLSGNCAWDYIELTDNIKDLVANQTDILYFGTLPQRNPITRRTTESLFQADIKFFCDLNIRHDFYDKEMLKTAMTTADLVKVNEDELSLIARLFYGNSFSMDKILEKIITDFGIEMIAVTLGENGALIKDRKGITHSRQEVNNLVDTVGAGDAYSAMFCIGYMNGWDIKKINDAATRFAAGICSVNGAIPKDSELYQKYKDEFVFDVR